MISEFLVEFQTKNDKKNEKVFENKRETAITSSNVHNST